MVEKFICNSEFAKNANLDNVKYDALIKKATNNYSEFWADLARENIIWHKEFLNILDESNAPFYKWFDDGLLNVSYNCLDRHLATIPNKIAIINELDDGSVKQVTYKELYHLVCCFANGLKALGVKKGDRCIIYLPNSIEAVVAMQACARIGAIHSVVFGGFSAKSVKDRILDAKASFIITADSQQRSGKTFPLKNIIDEAIDNQVLTIKNVIVQNRNNSKINWIENRDIDWNNLIKDQSDTCEPEIVESEHPLFILYTSGSTGTPKGVQHASAGFLLGVITTMKWVFDIKPTDIYWSTADVGWITGHSYIAYGPLATGITQVIFEGVPTYPDAGRFWQIIEKHKVSVFYTAPTALRSLIKLDPNQPQKYDLSSLRLLGSVGEPINPETWLWFYEVIGNKKCPIVDTWWQTETGCNMLSPIPGATGFKPGSCTRPIPGIIASIIDDSGQDVGVNSSGYLVIKKPFPSQIRTVWNNPEKLKSTYYPASIADGKYYVAGDSAKIDEDGFFWIQGRIDDVLNVSGHRLGTMEIESALVSNHKVAEAAVVGKTDDIKGESVFAFVVCKGQLKLSIEKTEELKQELRAWVAKEIGAIARPDNIRFVDSLPKTRSGKIMRRILRSIANGIEITQDVSTLENTLVVEWLKQSNSDSITKKD